MAQTPTKVQIKSHGTEWIAYLAQDTPILPPLPHEAMIIALFKLLNTDAIELVPYTTVETT